MPNNMLLWLLFVFVNRETQVGVAPGGSLQTVHADATGNAPTRPAQTSGRFQVTKWNLKFLGRLFQRLILSFFCVLDADLQTEAQHGSDSGWGRALQAGLRAGKRGLRQGMFLCRTHSLQDRGYPVSPRSHKWIFTSHNCILTIWLCCRSASQPTEEEKWWNKYHL